MNILSIKRILLTLQILSIVIVCGCSSSPQYPPVGDNEEEIAYNRIISLSKDEYYNTALFELENFIINFPNSLLTPALMLNVAKDQMRIKNNSNALNILEELSEKYPNYKRNTVMIEIRKLKLKN